MSNEVHLKKYIYISHETHLTQVLFLCKKDNFYQRILALKRYEGDIFQNKYCCLLLLETGKYPIRNFRRMTPKMATLTMELSNIRLFFFKLKFENKMSR